MKVTGKKLRVIIIIATDLESNVLKGFLYFS
jgi:hypothetical protein